MKKILGIIVLGLLLSGCTNNTVKETSLGDFSQFFDKQNKRLGGATVQIISITPKSLTFWYTYNYVSLMQVTNAAQYHCQKIKLDAILFNDIQLEFFMKRKLVLFANE